MTRTKVAVVGCGHLGTIHARLLAGRDDAELVAVVDPVPEARRRVAEAHRRSSSVLSSLSDMSESSGGGGKDDLIDSLDLRAAQISQANAPFKMVRKSTSDGI